MYLNETDEVILDIEDEVGFPLAEDPIFGLGLGQQGALVEVDGEGGGEAKALKRPVEHAVEAIKVLFSSDDVDEFGNATSNLLREEFLDLGDDGGDVGVRLVDALRRRLQFAAQLVEMTKILADFLKRAILIKVT